MVATVVLLALSVALVCTSIDGEREILPDEAEWVTSGFRTFQLYRDLASPEEWETAYLGLGDWGNRNPPIGKLLVGLGVAFVHQEGDRVRFITTWPFDPVRDAQNFPPPHYLSAARAMIAVFGCVCLLLVYVCAVQVLRRRWVPLVAPLILFSTWTFQTASTHVFTDIPQLAFLLGAIVSFHAFIASRSWPRFAIALICVGLSCAVKFSTGPIVVAALVFFVGQQGDIVQRIKRGLLVVVVPLGVFVAVNPYLYPAPIQRTYKLVERWSAVKRAQQRMPSLAHQAVRSRAKGIALVTRRAALTPKLATWFPIPTIAGLGVGISLFALLGFNARRRRESRRAAAIIAIAGLIAAILGSLLGGVALTIPLLAGAGVVRLAVKAKQRDATTLHFAIVFAVFLLFTALWLPFDWSRYYLPVMVLMAVVYAAGLAHIVEVSGLAALAARDQKATDVARAG